MRIWLLLSRFELGGIERVQINLAPAFKSAGFDTWIVAGKFLNEAENMLPVGIQTLEIAPRGPIGFISGLLRNLFAHRPDVVITTSNDVACMVLAIRAIFFPRMKVICAQHLSLSAQWHTATGFLRLKFALLIFLMRHLFPAANEVIAVSKALAADVQRVLKLKRSVHVIYNPIVLPEFGELMDQPIEWPWRDKNVPTIIFVGRLAKVKRLDLLMDAFLQVIQKKRARLLVLGAGPDGDVLLDFIRKNGLESSCQVVGHRSNPLPWIKASDILVLPSDYEGFGNVLVEAMACGAQVISTDCPDGPAEILGGGEYGQLFPVGSSHALTQALHRALSKEFHVSASKLKIRAADFGVNRASIAYLAVIHSALRNRI